MRISTIVLIAIQLISFKVYCQSEVALPDLNAEISTRGTQSIGRQYIYRNNFDLLPEEQQDIMLANPDKFYVEGISKQIIPVSYLNSLPPSRQEQYSLHPELYNIIDADPTQIISEREFAKMPTDKRAYILVNLDRYKIQSDEIITPVSDPPAELIILTQSDFENASAEKQQYILANPQIYQISE